ncbi:hypothetical protein D477_006421 [Arthrobacter crystallopoietes BAB-32]|uniref:DUF1508 domain-containing protein n=1 Tax=Arthrobacter crystallopoietes BAB-32 TaxID=1246476 RepID=N1V4U6_9MICC|nr:DUF1508 domain-containing protein [Arthrobacter crystallopoietes]EMY35044.1 hypothetical protein D477_006421 [Arthrobacter crystallopoietes BAB-32]
MFEIFRDTNKKYRFRLMEKDRVIAVSEGYEEKASVVAAINDAREVAATAWIKDKSVAIAG